MHLKAILNDSETNGTVTVILAADEGSGEECLILSVGEWKRLCKRLGSVPSAYDKVDEQLYDALHAGHDNTAALREAARMLSSGDKSSGELTRKLRLKGHSPASIAHALELLRAKGYLDDSASARRIAESAVRVKRWGRLRITDYLVSHGYARADAKEAADAIPDGDYREALRWQIGKKMPAGNPADRNARQKVIASLIRCGFPAGEVIAMLKETESEDMP